MKKNKFEERMQERHEEGFAKHKGEILIHDVCYIIAEELKDRFNLYG